MNIGPFDRPDGSKSDITLSISRGAHTCTVRVDDGIGLGRCHQAAAADLDSEGLRDLARVASDYADRLDAARTRLKVAR